MNSDREAAKAAFLKQAGLESAERRTLPGDASTRRYERLVLNSGATLMFMDAPPLAESQPCPPDASPEERIELGYNAQARLAAGRVDAFAATSHYLRGRGLSAPEVVALDAGQGLAVIEDLGDSLFARLIEDGTAETPLYLAAVEALARLHGQSPPDVLEAPGDVRWPLLTYDALALKTGADLFVEWAPKFDPRIRLDAEAIEAWRALWAPIQRRGAEDASVFTHRDYHAENLLWLAGRDGPARVGMIDFQDALRAHPSWDLHSMLQDARRDVSPELEAKALDHYFALRPEVDREAFLADYAGLAALNEARILGIFSRLVVRDGKPRYTAFMPRMWRQLNRNLQAPAMAGLKAWFDRHVPAEART